MKDTWHSGVIKDTWCYNEHAAHGVSEQTHLEVAGSIPTTGKTNKEYLL